MKLETIKSDFDDIYNRAQNFKDLLGDGLKEPNIEIHSGNFYGEERLKFIRFHWKQDKTEFYIFFHSLYFRILYINHETGTVDKRTLNMHGVSFVNLIYPYLQLFRK